MTQKTDALFQLIKSMDKAEKRNFKLLTQLTAGDKKYIQLFDAIDKAETYDEKRIIRQIKDERFTKQFSVSKNYLYNSILKSLAHFYKGPRAGITIQTLQAQILHEKNLQPQAVKLLKKAVHSAETAERFSELLSIFQSQREVLLEMRNYKTFSLLIHDIRAAESATIEKLQNLMIYQRLFDEVVEKTVTSFEDRRKTEKENFVTILEHPMMQSESMALSVRAKVTYLIILEYIQRYHMELGKCIDVGRKVIEILDANPAIKEDWIIRYVHETSNLSVYFLNRRDIAESRNYIQKLSSINTRNERASTIIFEKSYSLELGICHVTGEVKTGLAVLDKLESEIVTHKGNFAKSEELLLYYIAARFCLTAEDYSRGVRWLSRFFNEPRMEVRTDLQCFARILNLIIHFELGNKELLQKVVKSTYRFIYKRDQLHKTERAVLVFIRGLTTIHSQEDLLAAFTQLRTQIAALQHDPMEGPANRQLDLISWLNAKIENVPLAVIKQNTFGKSLMDRKERLLKGGKY